MKKTLTILFLIVLVCFLGRGTIVPRVYAECAGGATCRSSTYVCSPPGCDGSIENPCTSCGSAYTTYPGSCDSWNGSCVTSCTANHDETLTGACYSIGGSCSGGQIFCGGCINGCRPPTQTCNSWIAAECGGGGGGGGGGDGGGGNCGNCETPSTCAEKGGSWDGGDCSGGAGGLGWCSGLPCGGGGGDGECYPSCSPRCTQGDGCGGTCGSEDKAAPGTPTITSPINGAIAIADSAGKVSFSWAPVSLGSYYKVELYPSDNPDVDWTSVVSALSGGDNPTYSAYRKEYAFDLSTATIWGSLQKGSAVAGAAWIGQDLGRARLVTEVTIKHYNTSYSINSAHLQYSDNSTNWTTLQTLSLVKNNVVQTFTITPSAPHRYWRLLANDSPTNSAWFWGVADFAIRADGQPVSAVTGTTGTTQYSFVPSSRYYTVRVRARNNICGAYGTDGQWSNWVTFIATSPVTGSVYYDGNNTATLQGALSCTGTGADLPDTSADVTTTGGAIGGGHVGAYVPSRAFDNNNAVYWISSQYNTAVANTAWIGQNFGESIVYEGEVTCIEDPEDPLYDPDCVPNPGTPVNTSAKEIRKFTIRQHNDALYRVNSVHVEHSDDNSNWTTLQTVGLTNDGNTQTYFLNASAAHRYWRLRAASKTNYGGGTLGGYWYVAEVEMFEISAVDVGTLTIQGDDYEQQYSDTATVTPEGTYSINVPYSDTGTNQVALIIDRANDFICSCPIGCTFSGVTAPLSGLNFYITDAREPWFRVTGGSIMAFGKSGTVITDPIPTTCAEPTCKPYMIVRSEGQAGSSGLVLTGGGDVDLSRDTGLQTTKLDEDNRGSIGRVNTRIAQENYEYFYRLYKFPASPTSDFGETAVDAQKPTSDPANAGLNAYFHNGDLTIQDSWNVAADESIVIFVAGDLDIKNTVLVDDGGFLAFIVRGDITIDSGVGHQDPTAPDADNSVVEGVYIANGIILLPSRGAAAGGDYKFVGEGTFVGWQGVDLNRNFDDNVTRRVLNNTIPAEVFRYRPDFVVRAPEEMRTPRINWREVAP